MLNSPLGGRRGIGFGLGRSWQRKAGGFSPTDIAGLQLWLDFSDASTLFVDAGSTPVSADGDAIYQANDKSGNGRHGTQATPSARPTYKTGVQNGLSVARGDGGDMLAISNLGVSNESITFFCIVQAESTIPNVNNTFFGFGYDRLQARYDLLFKGNGAGSYSNVSGGLGGTVWRMMSYKVSGPTINIYRNGACVGLGDVPGLVTLTNGFIFARRNGEERFLGNIGECIVYNTPLSDTDRQSVESYLNNKWAIY